MSLVRSMALCLSVASAVIVGGGFASATTTNGNGSASVQHDIQYEIISQRYIALADTTTVAFGRVRQGHASTLVGPDILYATTWTGDVITLAIDPVSQEGISLFFDVLSITAPSSGGCTEGEPGTDQTADPVALTDTAQTVISDITNCGTGMATAEEDIVATTEFTVDATAATADLDYTLPVTTTVTYTIDAP
jgi:hypothetical protein